MSANATPSLSSLTLSPSPSPSTRRSLFSRLTSPLKARTRNLVNFHIHALEPHKLYAPGDSVKGYVSFIVVKPIRITHLTVRLHGFVRVFKGPNGANEPLPDPGTNATRKSQYFGNGHASLFQDEVALCGEGRLDPGEYEFNFELLFPEKGLPTSVDFERGTISYMIQSTITRPTSIAATSSCDQKISLVETVDIGPLAPPKPRTISLEPISRKSRKKKVERGKHVVSQDPTPDIPEGVLANDASRVPGSPLPDESVSQNGDADHNSHSNPRSPLESEGISTVSAATGTESTTSSSTGLSFRLGPVPSSAKATSRGSTASASDKTITATIELQKSGCLPGDILPLRISIKHTKAIKSMHGIIITLYRQGRIDSAPPLSLFADLDGKEAERLKHEEYYPKSKTGLGGLSLTSAGSSSVFRKDLAQTFAPILVDPLTLTTTVNASVRVPENVFPTIVGVPGEMISFKYHVEVVVDLGGKLAGQQIHVPHLGATALPSTTMGGRGDGTSSMLTAMGGSIVDTDHIRREKSVVGCLFEVVVGSTNTARKRNRNNSVHTQASDWPEEAPTSPIQAYNPIYEESPQSEQPVPYDYHSENQRAHENHHRGQYSYYGINGHDYQPRYQDYSHEPPPAHSETHVPLPHIVSEEGLSDKERARLAEQRLLPSQPAPDVGSSHIAPDAGPSVPSFAQHDDLYDADDPLPSAVVPSSSNYDSALAPSAPPPEDVGTDDKHELERRRLQAEASAPPDFLPDEEDVGEGSSRIQHAPSAPVMHDEYVGHYAQASAGPAPRMPDHEPLPKYER